MRFLMNRGLCTNQLVLHAWVRVDRMYRPCVTLTNCLMGGWAGCFYTQCAWQPQVDLPDPPPGPGPFKEPPHPLCKCFCPVIATILHNRCHRPVITIADALGACCKCSNSVLVAHDCGSL